MGTPSFIPLSQLQNPAAGGPTPQMLPDAPSSQPAPDFIPVDTLQKQAGPTSPNSNPSFIPSQQLTDTPPQVSDPDESTIGKVWDWVNKPLLDLHREGATGIEAGAENFASGLTSPLSIGLMILTG